MPPYAGPPVASRSGDAASPLRLLAYLALAITLIGGVFVPQDRNGCFRPLGES